MSNDHPVANAVAVRGSMLQVGRTESRSRAMITMLRKASGHGRIDSSPAPSLYLANVHLEAGADKGEKRILQLRSLLKRVESQCAADAVNAQSAPVVIAGDFNCDRASDLHSLLSRGTKGASASRSAMPPGLLPLRDAYLESPPPWGPPLRSSYRNGRVLDFIWASSAVEVQRTMPVSDMAGSSQPRQLPSAVHPSDHHPIGALLSWDGAPTIGGAACRPAWQELCVENVQRQQ